MRRASFALVAGILALGACSRTYESKLLALSYEPPKGFEFVEERPGPAPRAVFSNGLELVSVAGSLPEIEEGSLPEVLRLALTALGENPAADALSSRTGDVRGMPVARYSLRARQARVLLYVIPHGERFLVVRLEAGEAAYPKLEQRVDLSLASLRFKG